MAWPAPVLGRRSEQWGLWMDGTGSGQGRVCPVGHVTSRGIRPRTARRMAWLGQTVGRGSRSIVFSSTTRAAILIRRRRKVSNCATRHGERWGISARRLHISQYAPACRNKPELVGAGLGAGRAIGGKVRLPRLDVVFRRAASTIDVFIKHTSGSGGRAPDDEAGVCSVGASLDASDDALNPAPARGAVVKLRITAHL